ncbi:MAG TPA: hypothetical protein VHQ66_12845, partial [Myxococcota bacterium]|nr:hypothetical protein [Myxococcota bacterium]
MTQPPAGALARTSARLLVPTLFFAAFAAALAAPGRAADAAARCQKATAAVLSKCVASVGDAEAACFRKTGAACAASDGKLAKALAQLEAKLSNKCADAAAVAAAGYEPLLPAELAERFQRACTREVDAIAERVLGGPDAPRLDGASPDDAKCLLRAQELSADALAKAIESAGRCAGRRCETSDLDRTDAALEKVADRTATKLGKVCDDLAGLVGLDAPALASEAIGRAADAAAAPCDPLDPGSCLFPFPNDYFTVADLGSPTGRRLDFAVEAMPKNGAGTPVDPSRWNEVDGFSVGPVLLLHQPTVDLGTSQAPPITDLARSLEPDAP